MMTDWRCRVTALVAAGALLASGCVAAAAFADEPAAPAADGAACQADDWSTLKSCIDGKTGAVTVRLTAMIRVPDGKDEAGAAPVISNAQVTLKADENAGLTGLAEDESQVLRTPSVFFVASDGSLTITGGTYEHLDVADSGSLVNNTGALSITGGTFQNNRTHGNGGVVMQPSGSTVISGGTFEDNLQQIDTCDPVKDEGKSCGDSNSSGGGVIYVSSGRLTVAGAAKFIHNGATSAGWNSGGGAIWAQGTLTIKNGSTGVRPEFTDNYASVTDTSGTIGPDGTGDPVAVKGIQRGGAGGAVFLNATSGAPSTGYITGGVYTGNVSGYLGGAIYTEEFSTTYVGRAVATQNNAGHFGGGLWFCPSGNSAASKGGNIALYNNTVDASFDANPKNKATPLPNGADTTVAGSDLAVMNPYWKAEHNWIDKGTVNTFQLLDTWFTDRAFKSVTWYWDNTPLRQSSGFHDSWMGDIAGLNQGIEAVLATDKFSGEKTGGGLEQPAGDILLSMSESTDKNKDYLTTGLALKATVTDSSKEQTAWNSARLRFTGNSARLSGGAFASNGVVVFDTPYSMDWDKIDSVSKKTVAAASTWKLTYTPSNDPNVDNRPDANKSPYFDTDMRPADCNATSEYCWHQDDADVWTVLVRDNGRDGAGITHDNNPDIGSLSLDNLAPGDYTLQETEAPNGYQLTDKQYTFQIRPTQNKGLPPTPELFGPDGKPVKDPEGDNAVENAPISGVLAWSKTDAETKTAIGGSVWKIIDTNDKVVDGYDGIADCVQENACLGKDTNPDPGAFKLALGETGLKAGKYKLVETKAPDGHWLPADASHAFTVTDDLKVEWADEGDMDATTLNVPNTPTEVSWQKVDADKTDNRLAGSVWKLVRVEDGEGSGIAEKDRKPLTIADCTPDKCETVEGSLPDVDTTTGVIRLTGLDYGTYDLTESTPPVGYVSSGDTYTFTITKTDPEAAVAISVKDGSGLGEGNPIANRKSVSALPLTGGRSALDWSVTGGVLAILAGGMAVVADRLRRRVGVR